MLKMNADTISVSRARKRSMIYSQAFTAVVLLFIFMFAVVSPVMAPDKYTVKAGETLFSISKKYDTTIQRLKADNGLKGDMIKTGQTLKVPGGDTASRSNGPDSQDDIYWLSRAVYGEARGESYTGQVAVAAVIINRMQSSKFPNTIKGVIFENLAFTAVADGQIYLTPDATAIKAAREALAGKDPSNGALYYWNPAKSTSKWIWTRSIIKRIGNHVFGV